MSSLNIARAIIAGHLVRDPELKMTPSGKSCTTFTVVVFRKAENSADTVADFHTVIAWQKLAEHVCRYFRKGSAIYVDGKLRLRSYTDKNGVNRKDQEIVATDISFVDKKSAAPTEVAEEKTQAFTSAVPEQMAELQNGTDDDLPF